MAENTEVAIVSEENVYDKIYIIRGQKVMLDFDLAEIYGYTTTKFNQQVKNNVEKSEQKSLVAPKVQISEKEQSRLTKIKEANDLYERFKIDFMRDLQKEVSLMNRDMYDSLMDKIEVFLKKFPMPLSTNVSFGMANEACNQINKFIDIFGEISRSTYSPIVFGL